MTLNGVCHFTQRGRPSFASQLGRTDMQEICCQKTSYLTLYDFRGDSKGGGHQVRVGSVKTGTFGFCGTVSVNN